MEKDSLIDQEGIRQSVNDEVLFSRIAAGDQAAFSRAFAVYRPRLVYYARQFLADWSGVDDIVSEAFLLLWQAREKLQSDDHLRNYLFVTVRYRLRKVQQERERHAAMLEEIVAGKALVESADADEVDAEMMALIHAAVKSLPDDYQRIFELSYERELNSEEISHILQINAGTVRTQKRRALRMIREWIEKQVVILIPIILFLSSLGIFFIFFWNFETPGLFFHIYYMYRL